MKSGSSFPGKKSYYNLLTNQTMPKVLVIAGEASGDLHGGHVLKELKQLRPDLELIGTGGKLISELGAELYYRVEELAVIGFFEVAKRYSYYKGIFNNIVAKLDQEKPDAVFLVDYAGFNLKLAVEAKKRGIKVIFYVAPQVWAWKKKRIEVLKEYVDELIVLFPFEVDFFRKEGMETHCFGHPLLDIVKPDINKNKLMEKWQLDSGKKHVCLMPGSRVNEVTKHLPLLFETAAKLNEKTENVQFLIPLAPTVKPETIQPFLNQYSLDLKVVYDDTYNTVAHSDFALVASGTATLETAILGTPEVIYYKSSIITYLIGKYLLRIKMIGLPNIIANEMLVPEDPHFVAPGKMADRIARYLNNENLYASFKNNLGVVKSKLGEAGAYKKTAEFVNSLL